jgi:hypothetical protein
VLDDGGLHLVEEVLVAGKPRDMECVHDPTYGWTGWA